jgi:hypothetical protein
VNRFFTVAQLLAFNQSPPADALKLVDIGGGKKAAYLEGEYIRLVLNLLVGQGMWELKTKLDKHEITNIKKDIYEGRGDQRRKVREDDWVSISAIVHTSLVIYARDGSSDTRIYEATTVGDGMCDPKKGISDALDKAIKSAETDGLKRCAINLGKVFGLDINNKVKPSGMPKNLKHFEGIIAEAMSRRASNDTGAAPAVAGTTTPAIEAPAQTLEAEIPAAAPQRVEEPARQQPAAEERRAPPAREQAPEPARQAAEPAQAPTKPAAAQQETTAVGESAQAAPVLTAVQGGAAEAAATAAPEAPSDQDWELSMMPTRFEDWLKCIQTVARRMSVMTSEREIENFIRRNKKLIDKLPVFPATDGQKERNFKTRWLTIVNRRCSELGVPVPTEYAIKQAA